MKKKQKLLLTLFSYVITRHVTILGCGTGSTVLPQNSSGKNRENTTLITQQHQNQMCAH